MTSSPRSWLVDCQSWFRRRAPSATWCFPRVGGRRWFFFHQEEMSPGFGDDFWGKKLGNSMEIHKKFGESDFFCVIWKGLRWKAERKKQHLKRRQWLELDLSEALGRYFTFHDVTQLTPELHAGDRLQTIRCADGKLWTFYIFSPFSNSCKAVAIDIHWCLLVSV